MKVIATINFKGGVGKTTVTWLLAKVASEDGLRVLVVDADAQMSLTTALTVDEEHGTFLGDFGNWYENDHKAQRRTLLDALDNYDRYAKGTIPNFDFRIDRRFIYEVEPTLHFIPSTDDLYWVELEVFHPQKVKGFINALLGRLQYFRPYDLVFFDCPPSFTLLSYSILSNCSLILVPVNPDVFADKGLKIMIQGLRSRIQPWPEPKICVFMNKARGRYSRGIFVPYSDTAFFHQEVIRAAAELSRTGTPVTVLNTLVPERADIRRAISFGGFPARFLPEFQSLWGEVRNVLGV